MQLTQLEIKGFKSFGDKITINFNQGVTAIVGPNGCGKSNVVDAIRWVLGEQSTRMLRSEKMDNVIFNGTKSRKPANLAEVSLTFDNTKNVLPTDFSQVTLTRRLYRTGESEYRLNNAQCRLKDITDLFLDTGIGADSYSIIELRMIDEIITNKEGSRRIIFEEASGISKYKLRKKQTFNKLKDTETDLERVEDLLFEIEKNLKTLENQAKKTERYYKIKEQYKLLSTMLASFRIAFFNESLGLIQNKEQKHKEEKTGVITQIDNLEAVIQKQKLDSINKEKNLSIQQKATNEYVSKIRNYENEKKIKNEQLKFQNDKELRLTGVLEKDNNQLKQVLYDIKRLNEEKTHQDDNLEIIQIKVADLKVAVDDLGLQQKSLINELSELTNNNTKIETEVYQTEKDLDILKIQQTALEQESMRNVEDTNNKEVELSHFNEIITGLQSSVLTAEKEYKKLVDLENELQDQILGVEGEHKQLQESIVIQSRKLDATQNEYNLTRSMVDSFEGYPESIRFLKKHTEWSKNAPLFSDILFCKQEYRIAIENYLEPLLNHYVVDSYNEAIKAIELLSKSAQGKAQFFVLNSFGKIQNLQEGSTLLQPSGNASALLVLEEPPPFAWKELGGTVIPALDVVEVDKRFQLLCEYLLKNVYLIDDNHDYSLNNIALIDGVVLIGKSGKFNKSKYTITGGSVGLFEGKRIGRAKNLEVLLKVIKLSENILADLKSRQQRLNTMLLTLKTSGKNQEIRQNQQDRNQLNAQLITVQTRQEQYQNFIENNITRKDDVGLKITTLKADILILEPKLGKLKVQKRIQQDILLNEQLIFNELNEHVSAQSNNYNQENIHFHQQLNKISSLIKDLDYLETQRQNLYTQIKQNNTELEKVKLAILENLQQAGNSDDTLLAMYAQKDQLEKATQQAEQDYYQWRGKITATEAEITALRRKKDNNETIENELKDERNLLKLELSALKERLSVEFNIDIHQLQEIATTGNESEESVREKTQKLKKQLDDFGAINPLALEAYNEMNGRHTFIQTQKKDLSDAKASLISTIQEIDDTAKEKFMSSFTMVRENFIKVFRSLFNEGDSCDLLLSDPQNPLESEIDIIAKPKGKRPLSINQLSGGEKTLTATAILFSLYLLKPAPFCIFDEVDAPLDDTNIDKFNNIIREFSKDSQFIIISHNKRTIACTDIIYGVTMVEQGVSRVVPVDLRELVD